MKLSEPRVGLIELPEDGMRYRDVVEPEVQVLATNRFGTIEGWEYRWEHGGLLHRIQVDAGTIYDGASIPLLAQPFTGGKWGLGLGPPLPHDLFYRSGGDLGKLDYARHQIYGTLRFGPPVAPALVGPAIYGWKDAGVPWTRSEVDRLFARHMRELGVGRFRRRSAYRMVQLFGRGSWQG